jgi:hypothetical protein
MKLESIKDNRGNKIKLQKEAKYAWKSVAPFEGDLKPKAICGSNLPLVY